MSESEAVLLAIRTVVDLNKEANVSTDSLTTILESAKADSGKDGFARFSSQLLALIKSCFDDFKRVKPHLAKMRARRDFHRQRIETLPEVWKIYTAMAGGLSEVQPIDQQAVNREVFESCIRELLILPTSHSSPVKLLADEENAVRYAAGYVAMKLSKKIEKLI